MWCIFVFFIVYHAVCHFLKYLLFDHTMCESSMHSVLSVVICVYFWRQSRTGFTWTVPKVVLNCTSESQPIIIAIPKMAMISSIYKMMRCTISIYCLMNYVEVISSLWYGRKKLLQIFLFSTTVYKINRLHVSSVICTQSNSVHTIDRMLWEVSYKLLSL